MVCCAVMQVEQYVLLGVLPNLKKGLIFDVAWLPVKKRPLACMWSRVALEMPLSYSHFRCTTIV